MIVSMITRRQAALEVLFLLLIAALWMAVDAIGAPKRFLLPPLALALFGFALWTWRNGKEGWRDFGFRRDAPGPALAASAAWTLLAAAGIGALAWGRPLPLAEFALVLPLYCLYGTAQQFLFQGVLHRRLRLLTGKPIRAGILATAAFAGVHLSDPRLALFALVAGAAWSFQFARWGNLWALGLSHGVLAGLAYPLLLGGSVLGRV